MVERPTVAFFSIYSTDAKWWPQSPVLSLRRSQKLQRTRSEEYGGWSMVLQEQLLIYVGDVTRQITWCSIPVFFFFYCSLVLNQCVLDTNFICCIFNHHRLSCCHNCMNFGHIYSWAHLTLPHHHPVQMAEAGFMPQKSNFNHILAITKCTAF